MKIVTRFGMLVGLLMASTVSKCAPPKEPVTSGPPQHFVCNTGYTLEKCHKDFATLRKALDKYPLAQLGEWTWVLVRSSDWKSIQMTRGLDRNTPAFTYYPARETFLEEALVTEVPERQSELLVSWGMSMENLLSFAIAHELGHAVCNEKDEGKAERFARMLRDGRPASCEVTLQAKGRRGQEPNHAQAAINSN